MTSSIYRTAEKQLIQEKLKKQADWNEHNNIRRFFTHYSDDEKHILVEGVDRLCQDLQVDPTDFVVLVFAWRLNAAVQCQFTFKEFSEGCAQLNVNSLDGLKAKLPELRESALEWTNFKQLYKFTYSFSLDSETGQRTLPCELAISMWKIVFSHKEPAILQDWFAFLQQSKTRGITRDTWNMFLLLVDSLDENYSNYDSSEAWPTLFDQFVESKQMEISQQISPN